MLVIDILSIRHHIILNGLYFNLIIELFMYSLVTFTFRYIVKDIRTNPSNWTL